MTHTWQPTASLSTLQTRATILSRIRQFFTDRNVLEVETPQLSHAIGTDPYLHFFTTSFSLPNTKPTHTLYLQTSPEFAMKRLIAAGSGSIYQICKAYRNGDVGRYHNPEFTLLEWYRIGFNHHDLMNEMDQFLQYVLQCKSAEKLSYQALFEKHLSINPHTITLNNLKQILRDLNCQENFIHNLNKDDCLHYLLATIIEPSLGYDAPFFLYDFPISQAALARIRQDTIPVAERFEVYFHGIELANGFHELTDAEEQKKRFTQDGETRKKNNYPLPPIDNHFLNALPHLPDCAGVALGIDRLIMIATQQKNIQQTLTFPFDIA